MPRRPHRNTVQGAVLGAFAAAVLTAAAAAPARAGAWPREPRHWFLSSGISLFAPEAPGAGGTAETDLYAEGGLGGGWLVVLQATHRPSAGEAALGFGHAATRAGGSMLGWTLALGRRWSAGARGVSYLRPGLAWGRGFAGGERIGLLRLPAGGWVAAELQAEIWARPRAVVPKLDLTLGVAASERWTVLMELWADAYPGAGPTLRLGPAVVSRLGRVRLKLQPELPLVGDRRPRFTLALWSEF